MSNLNINFGLFHIICSITIFDRNVYDHTWARHIHNQNGLKLKKTRVKGRAELSQCTIKMNISDFNIKDHVQSPDKQNTSLYWTGTNSKYSL